VARGADYFSRGRVSIVHGSKRRIVATVRGSWRKRYEVEIYWLARTEGLRLYVRCTCPHFDDGNFCKHIWATLLEMDKADLGSEIPGREDLDVQPFFIESSTRGERTLDHDRGILLDDEPDLDDGEDDLIELEAEDSFWAPMAIGETEPGGLQRSWPRALEAIRGALEDRGERGSAGVPPGDREAWFIVDAAYEKIASSLLIHFYHRQRRQSGAWGKVKLLRVDDNGVDLFPPEDKTLLEMLVGNRPAEHHPTGFGIYLTPYAARYSSSIVRPALYDVILPRLCATNSLRLRGEEREELSECVALQWDDGSAWQILLKVAAEGDSGDYHLSAFLLRESETVSIQDAALLIRDGLVIVGDRLARLDASAGFLPAAYLRSYGALQIPSNELHEFLRRLYRLPELPRIDLPANLKLREVRKPPILSVRFEIPDSGATWQPIKGSLIFDYGEWQVRSPRDGSADFDPEIGTIVTRDVDREAEAFRRLKTLGFYWEPEHPRGGWEIYISRREFPAAIKELVEGGWRVLANGRMIRSPSGFAMRVSSGVDWFDLEGGVDYDGVTADIPEILSALKKEEPFVLLGDGTHGILPEEWLERYAPLAGLGASTGRKIRFAWSQAVILDALLASVPRAGVDAVFRRLRKKLKSFDGIRPAPAHQNFAGELRQYQSLGLGWLEFLREFGLGGILADDMGLGKTIQALSFLQKHYDSDSKEERRPSIIVVPLSLIHNWMEEAARFTPSLRVLDFTGTKRRGLLESLAAYHLILTTYGTLRKDIHRLNDFEFECAILDEAQAIKNISALTAKACRLIRARHKLALTGTPVENHLGELFSIFEFLNPGMLGSLPQRGHTPGVDSRNRSDEWLEVTARSLQPFILRRTKDQVLKELPAKTEQTLYCEMSPAQRRLYKELLVHFKAALAQRIQSVGMEKSKIHVLEALLRLRQAACHPGLLDESYMKQKSAKLDVLLERLDEVLSEGHKALVFSQFTSLLAIVRRHLDGKGIPYEYLDGRTRKRAERIKRFQEDPDCSLFLISLKAGGHGLNLTAANYVFILDPWWNPAVEAQAVDRTHRIGQKRPVFAYRLITSGTVEEKILELQSEKRRLAEAIVGADQSLLRTLTAEDLQFLLG
jgi:superfamily II DNA or RNA helicase